MIYFTLVEMAFRQYMHCVNQYNPIELFHINHITKHSIHRTHSFVIDTESWIEMIFTKIAADASTSEIFLRLQPIGSRPT